MWLRTFSPGIRLVVVDAAGRRVQQRSGAQLARPPGPQRLGPRARRSAVPAGVERIRLARVGAARRCVGRCAIGHLAASEPRRRLRPRRRPEPVAEVVVGRHRLERLVPRGRAPARLHTRGGLRLTRSSRAVRPFRHHAADEGVAGRRWLDGLGRLGTGRAARAAAGAHPSASPGPGRSRQPASGPALHATRRPAARHAQGAPASRNAARTACAASSSSSAGGRVASTAVRPIASGCASTARPAARAACTPVSSTRARARRRSGARPCPADS